METNTLLSINPSPVPLDEYRQELISALLFALKRPFLGQPTIFGENVTGFDGEETTAYYTLLDLLEKLLVDAGTLPAPPAGKD